MEIIKSIKEMQKKSEELRKNGKIIGFVPTMGALHEGHLELMRQVRRKCDVLVVSIFVNPIQFGPKEDYREYPRVFEKDRNLCEKEGVDIIFYPEEREMYPEGFSTYVEVEKLTEALCGRYRPGHFRGVTTVVTKLFNIVKPHIAAFGWKDAQQLIVIKKMVEDLNMDIEILPVETVREKDGLAMSSRNIYLTPEERKESPIIYKSLLLAKKLIEEGERDPEKVIKEMEKFIKENSRLIKIQYIEIVDIKNLSPVKEINGEILIGIACFLGRARLIDNIRIKVD
ncbi:MAG: pantoate--beta-alanine ligase [candidate division WOR-3 bacterium]